jgi:ribonuclease HI
MRAVKLFFDGGCRPMPAGMEIAVVVRGVAHVRRGLGAGTSMAAEWLALIEALRIARDHGLPLEAVVLVGDSAGVIGRAAGHLACRAADRPYRDAYRALVGEGPAPRLRHVKRAQNLAGIALAAAYR